MLINKHSNLKRLENLDYLYEEKIDTNEDIVIDLDDRIVFQEGIKTTKSIKSNNTIISRCGIEAGDGIKAGCGIKAGYGIEAGDGIEAGCGIKAGYGIKAGCGIKAGDGIEAGDGILAGLSITSKWISARLKIFAGVCTWRETRAEDKNINVEEVKSGDIAYGNLNLLPKKEIKEMTVKQISKALGYEVKIVKEEE